MNTLANVIAVRVIPMDLEQCSRNSTVSLIQSRVGSAELASNGFKLHDYRLRRFVLGRIYSSRYIAGIRVMSIQESVLLLSWARFTD